MAKNVYYDNVLKPISRGTARALGWLEKKDRELKSVGIKKKCSIEIKYPSEYVVCPKCNVRIQLKNLKKHYIKTHKNKDNVEQNPSFKASNTTQYSDESLVCCLLCLSKRPSVRTSNTIIKAINLENHISKVHKSHLNSTTISSYYKALELRRKNGEIIEKSIRDSISKHENRERLLSRNTDYITQPEILDERDFRNKTTGFILGKNSKKIKITKIKPK